MTIPDSFDDSNGKPKKMNAMKKHWGRQSLLLIPDGQKTMAIGRWLWYHVRY